jgi:RNA polymerase sigma factor (sigma-70 family)
VGDDDGTEKLTAAMAVGDPGAVETFYRRYFDWLYAQARRATRRDESFCLDVVQDAVLRIVRNVRSVKSEAQLQAWMKLVVRTTALDQLRGERRRETHQMQLVPPAAQSDAAHGSIQDEQIEWLRRQISRFDPQLVRMIELRFEQRWTLARIGRLLGLSVGAIDGRLRRAIRELRQRAVAEFDDE